MAVATVVIAVIVALKVTDAPARQADRGETGETLAESFRGVGEVLTRSGAWRVFAINFVGYSGFVAVLGLWGGPYLTDIHGLGLNARGDLLFVLAFAQVLAVFGWGPLGRVFRSRKRLVIVGACGQIAILLLLALSPPLSFAGLVATLIAFGISSAYLPVVTAHGRALFPDRLVGRGLTFMNMAVMVGAFTLQSATGFVAGLGAGADVVKGAPLPEQAYTAVFVFLALTIAATLACYAGVEDKPPRPAP